MNIENINNDEGWFEVKIKGSSLSAGNDFENTTHRLQIHPSVLSNFQKF
ncbi:MAG: hypothetical protein LBI53_05735 [Candidatus Peribacteria bacterium]|nr:hypothetical protein [Candidatus Peribacteria bacterium]